jgi:hypothetical protein
MERTWKPIVAGILCVIEGAIVVVILGILVALLIGPATTSDEPILLVILIFFVIPSNMFGILAIVGGICALRRRRWALALAGCICRAHFRDNRELHRTRYDRRLVVSRAFLGPVGSVAIRCFRASRAARPHTPHPREARI